jgi:hypothetical protein
MELFPGTVDAMDLTEGPVLDIGEEEETSSSDESSNGVGCEPEGPDGVEVVSHFRFARYQPEDVVETVGFARPRFGG